MNRFWEKVDRRGGPDSCWLWAAAVHPSGYGAFHSRPRLGAAHRVAWVLANGPIPTGLCVCHRCDERYAPTDITYRRCVNPAHLFLGSNADNMADMARKGRHFTRSRPERVVRGDQHYLRRDPRRICGTSNPSSKLTELDVVLIRHASRRGESYSALAALYQVSKPAIAAIVTKRTWANVYDPDELGAES